VVLAWVNGGRTTVVDSVNYGTLNGLSSYGMYPEGTQYSHQVFYMPTPGESNSTAAGLPELCINEWMADNKTAIADPSDGNYDDWLELYNAGTSRVDLAGYKLNDRLNLTNSTTIPGGTSIEPKGFLFVWADSTSGWIGTNLHVNFALSASGEAIGLFAPDGTMIDGVTFGAQQADVGQGRWPDADAEIYQMPISTPGASNILLAVSSYALAPVGTNLQATVRWNTRPGKRYRLERSDRLGTNTVWTPCAEDVTANGPWLSTNVLSAPSVSNRFFRILQIN
jgi:hypothetical protein